MKFDVPGHEKYFPVIAHRFRCRRFARRFPFRRGQVTSYCQTGRVGRVVRRVVEFFYVPRMFHIYYPFGGRYQLNCLYGFKSKRWVVLFEVAQHVRQFIADVECRGGNIVLVQCHINGTLLRTVCRFFGSIRNIDRGSYYYNVFGLIRSYKVPRSTVP